MGVDSSKKKAKQGSRSANSAKVDSPLPIALAHKKYLDSLSKSDDKAATDARVASFVRWIDHTGKCHVGDISPADVLGFSNKENDKTALPDTDLLKEIKKFLNFLHQEGYLKLKLSSSIRLSRSESGRSRGNRIRKLSKEKETVLLTREGHANLLVQQSDLQKEQSDLINAIERAAADGDFRENSPLDAAREEHARVSSKLLEVEETLRVASVIADAPSSKDAVVRVGSKLVLLNLTAKSKYKCQIVAPTEADPLKDKISTTSPVGSALLKSRAQKGAEVSVELPNGVVRYRVESVR